MPLLRINGYLYICIYVYLYIHLFISLYLYTYLTGWNIWLMYGRSGVWIPVDWIFLFYFKFFFYILATSKVLSGWVPTCDCILMATLQCCLMETPCHQYHDMISHSIKLSLHWVPSPCHILIMLSSGLKNIKYPFKIIGLTRPGIKPVSFRFSDLPKRELDAQPNESNDLVNWYLSLSMMQGVMIMWLFSILGHDAKDQHYRFAMSVHCTNLAPILLGSSMLPGCTTPIKKQSVFMPMYLESKRERGQKNDSDEYHTSNQYYLGKKRSPRINCTQCQIIYYLGAICMHEAVLALILRYRGVGRSSGSSALACKG